MNLRNDWWRRLRRVVALGLLAGLFGTPVGIAHLDLHVDVCDLPAADHRGAADAGVTAEGSFHIHDHCYTCHWLQSFRSTLVASGAVVLSTGGVTFVSPERPRVVERQARASVTSRAPPALCGLGRRV